MREFLLVVPDLMLAGEPAVTSVDLPLAALRFGSAAPLAYGWRAWTARRLRCAQLAGQPVAAVVARAFAAQALASAGTLADDGPPWLATPLHFVAGLETLHLPRDGILSLEPSEQAELAAGFAVTFAAGRPALLPVCSDTFLLQGLGLQEAVTVEPYACLGADLSRVQAHGAGAAPLRRLMAEIEMWLHDHPLNQRRTARGLPPVRSLWLWGAGAPSQAPGEKHTVAAELRTGAGTGASGVAMRATADPAPACVFSDDAWLRAVCAMAGIGLAAESAAPGIFADGARGTVLATARFAASGFAQLESFERQHLAPAVAALGSGRLGRLTVVAANRLVTVAANDRYRFWRPRQAWLTALGA